MKKIYLFVLILVTLIGSGCRASEEQFTPIKKETIPFNLDTANEMIKKKEKMIIDLSMEDKLTKEEYAELETSFTEEFGDRGIDFLMMFTIKSLDPDPPADTPISRDTFYPTLFHDGITITSATIYKSYYEHEFLNETILTIREEYLGEDENLKDWYREYIFTPNENGDWIIYGFSGVLNFAGDPYTMHYLDLDLEAFN